jgi:hypothetical protein
MLLNTRSFTAAFLATATFLTATASTGKDGWIDFRPADRSFAVQIPGFPSAGTTVIRDKREGLASVFEYNLTNDRTMYRIAETRLQPGRTTTSPMHATITSEAKVIGRVLDAELISSKEKIVGGNRVRIMFLKRPNSPTHFKAMTVKAGRYYFMIYAGVSNPPAGDHDVDRFLNSFRVTAQ